MTGYGAPGTPPAAKKDLPLFDLIGAGLGVLSFVWGFLPFYTASGISDVKGYNAGSSAIGGIALSILAGAFAGAIYLSGKPDPARPPYALAVAASALLVTFGAMVAKGTGADLGFGFYLLIVTTVAQTGLFAFSWLQLTGKIAAARPAPQGWTGQPSQQQPPPNYGGPQYGGPPPMPAGYGPGGQPPPHQPPPQPPAYSPPPTSYAPPQPPAYSPPPTSYAPPQPPQQPQPPAAQQPPPSYERPATPPPPGPASSFGAPATTVMPSTPPPPSMPPASGAGYGAPPPAPGTTPPSDPDH